MFFTRFKFALLTIILLFITYEFIPPLYQGDAGSATYLLNTIATSLSTIFALSLSLIMVAIQLSAGKYSPRIFDFFLRFSLNIPLIIIYITAILHSSFMLASIKTADDNTTSQFMRKAISFDIILMVYGFIILLIYIFKIVEMLKPDHLVVNLKKEIYEELRLHKLTEAILHMERLSDVAKKTTLDMDSVTAVACVRAISSTGSSAKFETKQQQIWFLEHIVANLHGAAVVALNQKVNIVAEVIIDEFTKLANYSIETDEFVTAEKIVETLSVIVSANLVGQQQLMIIQKVVLRMEDIAFKAMPSTIQNIAATNLVIKVLKTLNFLGKQIIESEVIGVIFVAKYMVTNGMGSIIATLAEKGLDKLSMHFFFEYVDLTVRVVAKGEKKITITFTTWMRQQLLEKEIDKNKKFLLLKIFLLISAVAIYLDSYDKASLIIRAIGKYFRPNKMILEELEQEKVVVRHFFDYHHPEKHLKEAFYIWSIYYKACKETNEINVNLSIEDVFQNLETWCGLFDGLQVDILTEEDITEKEE